MATRAAGDDQLLLGFTWNSTPIPRGSNRDLYIAGHRDRDLAIAARHYNAGIAKTCLKLSRQFEQCFGVYLFSENLPFVSASDVKIRW